MRGVIPMVESLLADFERFQSPPTSHLETVARTCEREVFSQESAAEYFQRAGEPVLAATAYGRAWRARDLALEARMRLKGEA